MMGRSGEEGRSRGAVYTITSVPFYWAGAVMQKQLTCSWVGAVSPPLGWWPGGRGIRGRAGAVGGAIYTTISVACGWAGAVMRKLECYGRS